MSSVNILVPKRRPPFQWLGLENLPQRLPICEGDNTNASTITRWLFSFSTFLQSGRFRPDLPAQSAWFFRLIGEGIVNYSPLNCFDRKYNSSIYIASAKLKIPKMSTWGNLWETYYYTFDSNKSYGRSLFEKGLQPIFSTEEAHTIKNRIWSMFSLGDQFLHSGQVEHVFIETAQPTLEAIIFLELQQIRTWSSDQVFLF